MTVSFDKMFDVMSTQSDKMEKKFENMLSSLGTDPSTQDLQKLQLLNTKYSMQIQLQSNTLKTISEALKSVVGNMR